MVNNLKQYSSRLTQVVEPLRELWRNNTLWCWESKHQQAFKAIKEELTKTPVLIYFDSNVDNVIHVDGFLKGLGAVLLKKGIPVFYVSRVLMPVEAG